MSVPTCGCRQSTYFFNFKIDTTVTFVFAKVEGLQVYNECGLYFD